MSDIQISNEQKKIILTKLQDYFNDELSQELSTFEAEFLLEFLTVKIGPYFYNQGLYDAQAVFSSKQDIITDAIYEIEHPIDK
jgi:uncharacterized protein (DUF2164 family)